MRDIHIHVVVDDTPEGESKVLSYERSPDGHYTVVLGVEEMRKLNTKPIVILAHELGHVLGLEFKLLGHKQVGQISGDKVSIAIAHLKGLFLKRENEAWDLAEEMFRIRSTSTESYLQGQREIIDAIGPILKILENKKELSNKIREPKND
jgi:hypothetical protein